MKPLLFLAASTCVLAACSGLEQPGTNPEMPTDGELVERVVFDVLPIKDGDAADTKASAVPNGGSVGFAWEATDTVAIFPESGSQVYFKIDEGNVGKSSANFDGGGWALKQGTSYISYYPLVGEFYLDRTKIPVSFAGQRQIGTTSPLSGARYFLASESTASENGVLRFSYNTLNTIINVNATLPAGTYTKASLTVSEPLFVEEGTFSLDDRTIEGTKFSTMLKMDLEDVTLAQDGVLPIYFMSAPVDLKDKEVVVKVISSDGKKYECVKTPSKAYDAGTRYGLTCDNMVQSNAGNIVFADANIKAALVAAFDEDEDGELSYMEAAAVTSIAGVFGTKKTYTSFDEFQYFTGVTAIPQSMFEGWQITSIILPESVSVIDGYAFRDCVNLTSIVILDLVKDICRYTFSGCSSLTNITLPESVTSIGSDAFRGCSSLTSVSLPESVTSIGSYAFDDCSSLTNITIPQNVYKIEYNTFSGCSSLTSIIIPESVTSIGSWAFGGCSSLTSVTLPDSVTSIGINAFDGCSSLTNITIPQDVYKIERYTFYGCSSLTSVFLPESVTSIGSYAFSGCSSLTNITIPQDVYKIEPGTFSGCSSLTNITLPESVTSIGDYAFSGCSSLSSITIPESVTSIGSYAFSGCSSLSSITIPESVTSIGSYAFSGCSSLTNITIPQDVYKIEPGTFDGCSSLTNITLPESVTSIGEYAFYGCSSLSSITIPESVTSIKSCAFYGCSNLNSIVCLAETPPFVVADWTFSLTNNCPIYVPSGSVAAYKAAEGWSSYADRIQSVEGGDVPPSGNGGDD